MWFSKVKEGRFSRKNQAKKVCKHHHHPSQAILKLQDHVLAAELKYWVSIINVSILIVKNPVIEWEKPNKIILWVHNCQWRAVKEKRKQLILKISPLRKKSFKISLANKVVIKITKVTINKIMTLYHNNRVSNFLQLFKKLGEKNEKEDDESGKILIKMIISQNKEEAFQEEL